MALVRMFNESGALLTRIMEMRDVGFAPIKSILAEGQASGELVIADVGQTLTALFGATLLVGLDSLLSTGQFDREAIRSAVRSSVAGLLPDAAGSRRRRVSKVAG